MIFCLGLPQDVRLPFTPFQLGLNTNGRSRYSYAVNYIIPYLGKGKTKRGTFVWNATFFTTASWVNFSIKLCQ